MTLAGRRRGDQDFPYPVRESVTTLPFHAGGTRVLAAGAVEDLVKVADLRRFENMAAVALGTHSGAAGAALEDSGAEFVAWGVEVGDTLFNLTQVISGPITAVSGTELTAEGVAWVANDEYRVDKTTEFSGARPVEIRRVSLITDRPIYIRYDGVPDSTPGF